MSTGLPASTTTGERPARADSVRNRALVLEAATDAFARDGVGVSISEIAKRAGVSTGTVSRHFPTKDGLLEAIVMRAGAALVERGNAARDDDAATALPRFFRMVVDEGIRNRVVAQALAGAGYDLTRVGLHSADVLGLLSDVLMVAQDLGSVRPDVVLGDVVALIGACAARAGGPDDIARMTEIAIRGLRPV